MSKTALQLHAAEWKDCQRCELSERRNRIVLLRGKSPCDIVFIGEAPGQSEDSIGQPFVGPAGDLLDNRIIKPALGRSGLRIAYANLLACIPYDEHHKKVSSPPYESVVACSPRLTDLVGILQPKLIVMVGKEAEDWLMPGYQHSIKFHLPLTAVGRSNADEVPGVDRIWRCAIQHPAAIIRANITQQSLLIQRARITIAEQVEELVAHMEALKQEE